MKDVLLLGSIVLLSAGLAYHTYDDFYHDNFDMSIMLELNSRFTKLCEFLLNHHVEEKAPEFCKDFENP